MRKNWPYFIVASFLNALLVTAVFLEFKLRGIAVFDPANRTTGFPSLGDISPFQFAGGMFVLSFLIIVAIIGIRDLVSGIFKSIQLQATRYKLQGIHFRTQVRN